uniref:Uncharacterized protein n=1 Tax=Siphoviridae sp. ct5tj9 TaxID=2823564 RepID=A0A8S5LGZ3_9CAUD|nr:MAG TPA: hypothetical protein [Siphoviridae sp. ct5tj9]
MWCRLPNNDLPFLLNYHRCLLDFKVLFISIYMRVLRKPTSHCSYLENWSL